MNVAELIQALEAAPEDSTITVRMATGEMCPVSAVHIGAGGDSAGTISFDCAPVDSAMAADPEDDEDVVDSLARQAGVLKPKAKAKPYAGAETDEEEAAE